MAFVAQGWDLVIAMKDRGDKNTTRTYRFVDTDDAGDASALFSAATAAITKFNAVSDMKVYQYSVKKVFVDDAFSLSTSPTSDRSTHAEISAVIYGKPNKHAIVEIPGPKDTVFVDGLVSGADTDIVDTENADVLAFVGLFTQAGNQFYISDGEQIANGTNANLKGKRTHSADRNG